MAKRSEKTQPASMQDDRGMVMNPHTRCLEPDDGQWDAYNAAQLQVMIDANERRRRVDDEPPADDDDEPEA